jgi:hypothetical protein
MGLKEQRLRTKKVKAKKVNTPKTRSCKNLLTQFSHVLQPRSRPFKISPCPWTSSLKLCKLLRKNRMLVALGSCQFHNLENARGTGITSLSSSTCPMASSIGRNGPVLRPARSPDFFCGAI